MIIVIVIDRFQPSGAKVTYAIDRNGNGVDGTAYKEAINHEFYDHHQSCKYIADVALQESLNNVLEKRMHGSIREREKVMRDEGR